jgi:hypothetical protein
MKVYVEQSTIRTINGVPDYVEFRSKIGTSKNKQHSRIWIEGNRLVDAGFTVGTRYTRTWNDNKHRPALMLKVDKDGFYRVSGKGDKPVIDITGEKVNATFLGEYVTCSFFIDGTITIRDNHA